MDLGIDGITSAEEIGSGSSAKVYRAEQDALSREVAVKVLRTQNPDLLRRFKREAKALGRLSRHPRIVTLYELGRTQDGYPYLVLALCEESLLDRIRNEGPLDWHEACSLVRQVSEGVAAAHAAGIVHRDMKPANILTGRGGDPLITDFGISVMVGSSPSHTARVGLTPGYAAPETFSDDGGQPGKPADVYALGATLFHLLTGRVPFSREGGLDLPALIEMIVNDPVPDIRSDRIPDGVAELVERLLAKAPGDRPTAVELHRELSELLGLEHEDLWEAAAVVGVTNDPFRAEADGGLIQVVDETDPSPTKTSDAADGQIDHFWHLDADPVGESQTDASAELEPPLHLDGTESDEGLLSSTRVKALALLGLAALLAIALGATGLYGGGAGEVGAGSGADDERAGGPSSGAASGDDGAAVDRFGAEDDDPAGIGPAPDGDGAGEGDAGAGGNGTEGAPSGPTTSSSGPGEAGTEVTNADGTPADDAASDSTDGGSTDASGSDDSIGGSTSASTAGSDGPPNGDVTTSSTRPAGSSSSPSTGGTASTATARPLPTTTRPTVSSTTRPSSTSTRPSSSSSSSTSAPTTVRPTLTIVGEGRVACFTKASYTASADEDVTGWAWATSATGITVSPASGSAAVLVDFGVGPGFYDLTASAGGGTVTRRIEVVAGDGCAVEDPLQIVGPQTVECRSVRGYRVEGDPVSVRWDSPNLPLPDRRDGTSTRVRFSVQPGTYRLDARVDGDTLSLTIQVTEPSRGVCPGA